VGSWPPRHSLVFLLMTADEWEIAQRRGGGTSGRSVPIWVVSVGTDVYVRSWCRPGDRVRRYSAYSCQAENSRA
jgi:hypothetical protein